MFSQIRKVPGWLLSKAAGLIPSVVSEWLIKTLVTATGRSLPPDKALRFLFRLDTHIYSLEGVRATDYGGGIHTKHRHTRYHDFFVDRISAGERVLDVGCGNGALAADVADRSGAEVTGIDIDADKINLARENYGHPNLTLVTGDVLKNLPEGAFDTIILSNVLEHLPGRSDFLRRLQKAAAPKRFLIRVPLFDREWRVPLKKELGVEWRLDPTHETEYTQQSFADELDDAGFKVIHQSIQWGEIWAEIEHGPASVAGR